MKKISLLLTGMFMSLAFVNAQDTLLYENFEDTLFGGPLDTYIEDFPPGVTGDLTWYNYDEDQIPDGSGASRPDLWYLSLGFGLNDTNDICMVSNSWTNDGVNPVANWLFLPAIQITDGASAWLKWKSAPFQTPRFCDGFEIRVSTTINDHQTAFTDVLYTAAEYESGAAVGPNYASYVFSSPGFVHGADGFFRDCSECVNLIDSSRWRGIQRPDSVSLAAYDNQMIYIAFKHNTTDDNLISIDDILVIENTDPTFSVEQLPDFAGSVYPNPATDYVNVNFDIEQYHNASVFMVNSSGQIMYTSVLTTQNHRIDLANISSGVYFVKIVADEGSMVRKVVVNK
jgi:hypothetical protein